MSGNPDSQYNWGKTLVERWEIKQGQAFMEAAAGQGHFMAQNDLGGMMFRGQGTGEGLPDLAEAERWYLKSAAQGFQKSMLGMSMVRSSQGRPNEALEWLEKAAEQRADPVVPFTLGTFLMEGTLSENHVDAERGRFWMSKAADMGHSGAQVAMARESGGDLSSKNTAMWAKRAADQGNREGATLLARQYLKQGNLLDLLRLGMMWFRRGSLLARFFNSSKTKLLG
jgi:TPR repeat protein